MITPPRVLSVVVSSVVIAALLPRPAFSQPPTPPPDAVVALNEEFDASYAGAKARAMAQLDPVIEVYEGDKLVLVRHSERREAVFSLVSDARLKAVAQTPIGVFTTLSALGPGAIPAESLARLTRYRDRVQAAREALAATELAPALLARQQQILDAAIAILSQTIEAAGIEPAEIAGFARQMAPLLLENAADSARAQLERIHTQVALWQHDMTADEWTALRVVIMGAHTTRDGELALQYFERRLGEPGEGHRIVYAEGIADEDGALDLMATHVLDGQIGAAFFGQEQRMHRDLPADAARAHLDALGVGP